MRGGEGGAPQDPVRPPKSLDNQLIQGFLTANAHASPSVTEFQLPHVLVPPPFDKVEATSYYGDSAFPTSPLSHATSEGFPNGQGNEGRILGNKAKSSALAKKDLISANMVKQNLSLKRWRSNYTDRKTRTSVNGFGSKWGRHQIQYFTRYLS